MRLVLDGLTAFEFWMCAISPELCVVRLARLLPRLEFLRAATDLLGIYAYSHAGDVDERRRRTHGELLRFERKQRERPSLAETARWRFLLPYLDLENPL